MNILLTKLFFKRQILFYKEGKFDEEALTTYGTINERVFNTPGSESWIAKFDIRHYKHILFLYYSELKTQSKAKMWIHQLSIIRI